MDDDNETPVYLMRVSADGPGMVLIETLTSAGVADQEIWCTVDQARSLIPLLEALQP